MTYLEENQNTRKVHATTAQKLMVFVLSMSIYGLATLFTELLPSFNIGLIELSVEYLLFIPLTLAILLDPMSAALGAAVGELIFSEIMLGQFGGLGELEKFIRITLAVYIAGRLVRDPKNRKQIAFAVIIGLLIDLGIGTLVDISKVQIGVEDFEAVEGLPESVWLTEGFAFLNDLLFSGVLFALLPTLYLVPKLNGKIEPLLGMEPRTKETNLGPIETKVILFCLIGVALAFAAEIMSEMDLQLVDWEADWAESKTAIAIAMITAAVIAIVSILVIRNRKSKKNV